MNAVPLADEGDSDFFADQGGAVGGYGDGVFEIGDSPAVRLGRGGDGNGQKQEQDDQSAIRISSAEHFWDFNSYGESGYWVPSCARLGHIDCAQGRLAGAPVPTRAF